MKLKLLSRKTKWSSDWATSALLLLISQPLLKNLIKAGNFLSLLSKPSCLQRVLMGDTSFKFHFCLFWLQLRPCQYTRYSNAPVGVWSLALILRISSGFQENCFQLQERKIWLSNKTRNQMIRGKLQCTKILEYLHVFV